MAGRKRQPVDIEVKVALLDEAQVLGMLAALAQMDADTLRGIADFFDMAATAKRQAERDAQAQDEVKPAAPAAGAAQQSSTPTNRKARRR